METCSFSLNFAIIRIRYLSIDFKLSQRLIDFHLRCLLEHCSLVMKNFLSLRQARMKILMQD